jgi:hypothetical protein
MAWNASPPVSGELTPGVTSSEGLKRGASGDPLPFPFEQLARAAQFTLTADQAAATALTSALPAP